ncbi:MAG: GGDEF domain-containing protein [Candidatus Dormibacteria bacterium]
MTPDLTPAADRRRRTRPSSFTARLLAFSMALVLLVTAASALVVIYVAGDWLTRQAGNVVAGEAAATARHLAAQEVQLDQLAQDAAANADVQDALARQDAGGLVVSLARAALPSTSLLVARSDGALLAGAGPMAAVPPALLAHDPAVTRALAGTGARGLERLGPSLFLVAAEPAPGGVVVAGRPFDQPEMNELATLVDDPVVAGGPGVQPAASSGALANGLPSDWAGLFRSRPAGTVVSRPDRIGAGEPLVDAAGQPTALVLVMHSLASTQSLTAALTWTVLLIGLLVAGLGVAVLTILSRGFIRGPVGSLTAEVRRIAAGDLETAVAVSPVREFAALTDGVDSMRVQLAGHLRRVELRGSISQVLQRRAELVEQLQTVLDLAREITGAGQALLITHVTGFGGFDFTLASNFPEAPDRLWLISDHGLLPRYLRHREPAVVNTIDPAGAGAFEEWLPVANLMTVPLVLGEEHRGALFFFNREGGFGLEHLRDAREVAEEVVISFEKAMLLVLSQRQATTDALTGLHNHRFLKDYLEQQALLSGRHDEPLSILMLDLDHFKGINDQHGHLVGDNALRAFARCVLRTVRRADLVARYGGEEFVVVMPGTTGSQARVVAEKIREAVHEIRVLTGPSRWIQFTVSIGGVVVDGPAESADEMLEQADRALYRAKSEGRDRVVFPLAEASLTAGQESVG